jgi:hypothetical protein
MHLPYYRWIFAGVATDTMEEIPNRKEVEGEHVGMTG